MIASVPVPAAAPPRVRDLLRRTPDGPLRLLHRGPQAVYVDVGGTAVGVLARDAVLVPNGLRTNLPGIGAHEARTAYAVSGVLHIDGRPLPVRRVVGVHIPTPRHVAPRLTANSATPAATPPAAVAEFVVSSAPHGVDAAAVARLVGRGDGLTPLGDDVLCGWLAARHAQGRTTPEVDAAVRAHAHRTTLLSATLLDCALHGEAVPQLARWLADPTDPAAADALLAIGGTSGAGLMAGALLALETPREIAA